MSKEIIISSPIKGKKSFVVKADHDIYCKLMHQFGGMWYKSTQQWLLPLSKYSQFKSKIESLTNVESNQEKNIEITKEQTDEEPAEEEKEPAEEANIQEQQESNAESEYSQDEEDISNKSPIEKIINHDKNTLIEHMNSDDEIETDDNAKLYEKYKNMFNFYKKFSEEDINSDDD